MKNKQPFQFRLLVLAVFLFVPFLIPNAQAAYDCAYNVNEAALSDCCYDGEDGYQGIYCNPSEYIQKPGSDSPVCLTSADILLGIAKDATDKGFTGFNCFNTNFDKNCNASNLCYLSSGDECIVEPTNQACVDAYKVTNCNNSCGVCIDGYASCGGACVEAGTVPVLQACTDSGRSSVCGGCGQCVDDTKIYCSGVDQCITPKANSACLYGVNTCTGACESCPTGTTPSGKEIERGCISYAERFTEIASYGLATFGYTSSPAEGGQYDYSITGVVTLMKDIYLKADVAETLNWNSSTLPPVIQDLISNYYDTCNITSDCSSIQTCSEGGICYTEGVIEGGCANSSDCALGYNCNANNVCSSGDESVGESYFAGLSSTAVDGDQGGYFTANAQCGAGSHICTSKELIDSYVFGAASLNGVTGNAWINSAAPGNMFPAVNDCYGWTMGTWTYDHDNDAGTTEISSPFYGTMWSFDLSVSGIAACPSNFKFACCK